MIKVDVRMDVRRMNRALDQLSLELREKATVMAINKVLPKAKTEMVRAISSDFNILQKDVRPRIRISKANRFRLTGSIRGFDSLSKPGKRSMNLIHFLEKKVTLAEMRRRRKSGTHKDLRFKIKRHGAPQNIKGAFIGNKGRTIFRRKNQNDPNSPIEAVSTVGVSQMFNTKKASNRVLARIRKELPVEFERASRQILRRFNR